ncbi:MAG: acyl-CoA dehydrogenase family protein [Dehalococcoidales bacterium]|nr:acyl-CoA dehydrogenase family protein [Dehalococcoidales bacterium]
MLDFTFSEEQNMLRAMIKEFGTKELADSYKDRVKEAKIPSELIRKVADLGLMGLNIPEEYGGFSKDAVTNGIVVEELAKYADDASWLVFNNYGLAAIIGLGCEEIKREWLPAMASGDKIVCMGATEAEAGSDLGNLKTTFKDDGDYYILNGEKNRVTFATQGDAVMVLAKSDITSRRITPFLVPFDTPGISISKIEDMGCEATEGGIVSLEDLRLPSKYLLGDEEGKGFQTTMRAFDCLRIFGALQSLSKAEVTLQETIEYAKQRVQFGKPISKFQGTSFRIAEAATYLELGRWLCYRVLWMRDNGLPHRKESAMAKWWCPRIAFNIIHECLLIHGHYGYSKDLPIEQRLRDSILTELGDGTAEIMKLIICRELLGREFVE